MSDLISIFKTLDKKCTKWTGYFDVYETHLSKFRNKSPRILDIGTLEGGSIEMWLKYFGEGTTVVGVDIEKKDYTYDGNVILEQGDQGDPEYWDGFIKRHEKFDIIIDDGGHTMDQQNLTLFKMFSHLNDNGVYAVEDTHTSYWQRWGGKFDNTNSFLNLAKRLTDIVNQQHFVEEFIHPEFLKVFENLHSLAFYNSLVILEKKKPEAFKIIDSK